MKRLFRGDFGCVFVLVCLAGFLYFFRLGGYGLLDPDEPFYALTAKEMALRHQTMTPLMFGQPQFEKPILFYWVLLASFRLFGVTEFAARFGPAAAGLLTVLAVYGLARVLFPKRRETAFLSALFLATACAFAALARVVLTDMYLCLFVTAAFLAFAVSGSVRFSGASRKIAGLLFFVFCALGFLTKGPLGLLIPLLGIVPYLALDRQSVARALPWKTGLIVFALIGFPWYGLMAFEHGPGFLKNFFVHENVRRFFMAEHSGNDRFWFYPAIFMLGFFPWSLFLPGALWRAVKRLLRGGAVSRPFLFLSCSWMFPFIFFCAAKSKLISYILPLFPVAAVLIGSWAAAVCRAGKRLAKGNFVKGTSVPGAVLWVLAPAAIFCAVWAYNEKYRLGLAGTLIFLGAVWLPLLWMAWRFYRRGDCRRCVAFASLASVFFGAMVFGKIIPACETGFSTRRHAERLIQESQGHPPAFLLGSKFFVRGVSYYTGEEKPGVLTGDVSKVFYTRHPIPLISNKQDWVKWVGAEGAGRPVYAFLREKELAMFKEVCPDPARVVILQAYAGKVLVKFEAA